ncbi:type IV secretory system conjugative DNA transfer family protein [Salipiger abyssi]|uniref:type IV secretory system conjugative DNA transfer family protein n=1 Tax=Salipiger abyssi TaxID=1250539 RepID=UPI001A8E1CF6|nr:type IV secretory system conjugative DNA transfer family protein [Salipiger abyssi]MBN9889382.1 type IV secretory system conjugative DNA transfer family protein [Salipiger abyssi]
MRRFDFREKEEAQRRLWSYDPDSHGSAKWADSFHLAARGYGPAGLHTVGYLPVNDPRQGAVRVSYGGDRHELIVAPTRGGKGVSGSIPRLLEHQGSAIVLDIKDGELAFITARYRRDVLGQNVILIDPFDVAATELGFPRSSFNPCARIEPFGDDAFDDAMLAADSLVIPDGGSESHWSGEAASMIAGVLLHTAEQGTASLKAMRKALNASRDEFRAMIDQMLDSPFDLVKAAGGRIDNKEERELSSVISTAQRNTHFLESPRLADALNSSDFDPATIGEDTSIYIILPARRIGTARRFLRVLIGALISSITTLPEKPSIPVMFLLEEMATLERMAIIEQAVGLMAGFGMQFVMVVQDFTQLKDLYQNRWESFLANSALIQCFGTNDRFTADYLSALCGQTSLHQLSLDSAMERGKILGDPNFRSFSDSSQGRALITSTELMSLHPSVQVAALAAARPVIGYRPVYFLEKRFRDRRGMPLYDIHPSRAGQPISRAVDFSAPGLALGAMLGDYLSVG